MSLRGAIYTRLTTFAGVVALAEDRAWDSTFPEDPVFPGNVFQIVTNRSIADYLGGVGLARTTFQIDSFAYDSAVVENLGEQVRLALQGFSGTVAGVRIDGIIAADGGFSNYDPEVRLWRVSRDFAVWHRES